MRAILVVTSNYPVFKEFIEKYSLDRAGFLFAQFPFLVKREPPGTPVILYGSYHKNIHWKEIKQLMRERKLIPVPWAWDRPKSKPAPKPVPDNPWDDTG